VARALLLEAFMTVRSLLIVMAFIFAALSPGLQARALAQTKNCFRTEDASRLRARFHLHMEDAEDLCDPNGKTRRVLEALLFAENLKFSAEAQAPAWDQKILPPQWLDYLAELSPTIRACPVERSAGKILPGGKREFTSIAYVLPSVPKTLFLCESLFSPELHQDTIDLLATLLHESRHQGGYEHTTCTRGNNKDIERACDPNYQFKGGYAVDVEAYLKIGILATNVTAAQRVAALDSALAIAQNSFNEPPDLMEAVSLLQTESGEFYRFDGTGLRAVTTLPKERVHIAPTSAFGVQLLRVDGRERALQFGSLDGKNFSPERMDGDVYEPYDKTSESVRRLFSDAGGFAPTYAFIAAGHVMAVTREGTPAELQSYNFVLPRGTAIRVYTAGELPNAEPDALYVLSTLDELFKVRHGEGEHIEITPVANPYRGFVAVALLNGRLALLNSAGRLFIRDAHGTRVVPGSENLRFVEMSRPFKVIAD
jgi:hypothetical protein